MYTVILSLPIAIEVVDTPAQYARSLVQYRREEYYKINKIAKDIYTISIFSDIAYFYLYPMFMISIMVPATLYIYIRKYNIKGIVIPMNIIYFIFASILRISNISNKNCKNNIIIIIYVLWYTQHLLTGLLGINILLN